MSRLFVSNRELRLINDLIAELNNTIIGQTVFLYNINEEKTKSNLYGESSQKIFDPPIEIRTIVEYTGESDVSTGKFGIDNIFDLKIYFHQKELVNKNIELREGSFINYGNRFYEILKLTRPKDIFGLNENLVGIHAECRIAREGQFRTAEINMPAVFEPYRGKASSHGGFDKRELQELDIINRISGSLITSDFNL